MRERGIVMNKRKMLLLTACILGVLFLSGCSEVYVTNLSELNVRVSVVTPDTGKPSTRLIRPAGTTSIFSSNGGRYRVTILPDEEYRKLLDELKQEISRKLFHEGATLTSAEVKQLTQRLNDIDQIIGDIQDNYGASCSGYVPDYDSVTAFVSWDSGANKFVVQCGSGSSN